jgi:hypothetical protein
VSTRAPSPTAHRDGGTRGSVHRGGTRSNRRGACSSRRAARHRSSTVPFDLRQQAFLWRDQGEIRQRYDEFRISTNRGINNINNLGEEQLRDNMDEFQGLYSQRTEELRQSHQHAALERYKLLHIF